MTGTAIERLPILIPPFILFKYDKNSLYLTLAGIFPRQVYFFINNPRKS
jgi:hypothetical protein